ncbi:MAG: hybrid sensor histidine kinase/response regulator [Deltaproteobacteria bacterium]|jgi:signal transduction histidine kinase|nr:hybrid sensor histidine kinase/response regulator [Deltaproteobacteria bacterium]MDD3619497.1 hybrid sensor histidine kinase/response regulator [Desulfobulbaceae bacterium]
MEQIETKKKASIVVVDDEQSILKELRILLGRLYKVHVFTNPEEAEKFVDENDVDMVISDEMMPEMRGSVLLGRIHRKHPDICNIVLSGQAEKDDIVKAVNDGHIFSFLYKPTERQQLINVIEKGLENRRMKRILAEQNIQLKEYSENLEKMVEEKTAELAKAYDRLNLVDANKVYFLIYLAQEMDSSLDRIKKLVEVLLDYFAFTGSEIQVNNQAVVLGEAVDQVLDEIQGPAARKGLKVEKAIEGNPVVTADPAKLAKALRSVLDNAVIFTPEGGRVTITGQPVNGRVRLRITDTGKGIEPWKLRKIFKPFVLERGDRNPDGFGLNLPMAHAVVKAMGGKIWAESDGPGKGTTISLELPAAP